MQSGRAWGRCELSAALKGMSGTPGGGEGPQSSLCLRCFPHFSHLGMLSKKQTVALEVKEGRQRFCISNKLPGDADVAGSKDKSGTTELPACASLTFGGGRPGSSGTDLTGSGRQGAWLRKWGTGQEPKTGLVLGVRPSDFSLITGPLTQPLCRLLFLKSPFES